MRIAGNYYIRYDEERVDLLLSVYAVDKLQERFGLCAQLRQTS